MQMMKHRLPAEKFREMPCIRVAVGCAGADYETPGGLKDDGYCSLQTANKYIRERLKVIRRINFRRGERPTLKDLIKGEMLDKPAIVCVLGHFLYVDGDTYYSFFKNGKDDVVAVWEIDKITP